MKHSFAALLTRFVLVFLVAACSQRVERGAVVPRTGPWLFELQLTADQTLPFTAELLRDSSGTHIIVRNGTEHITVDDVSLSNDTIRIRMPLFDSEFIGVLSSDSLILGHWHNHLKGPDYKIPFRAVAGVHPRFVERSKLARRDLGGHWETHYSPGAPDAYDAIGVFEQTGSTAHGTFITETGDYRYLEGSVDGDSLRLSCFDGSHAFLFKAVYRNDSLIGRYWSGSHWQEPWVATRNPSFKLRDPDSLTFLREGYDMVDFHFPLLSGGTVSPKDAAHAGKVIMVQIMGSWCPNCVDETELLDELYSKYADQGLSVVALAFEKQLDTTLALESLKRFRDRLNVKYDIAYAGTAAKEEAAKRLPFLNHVMSYPTCIFIDRAGMVRRIRTGFYGPGTGDHYVNYRRNLEQFLQQMLAEPVPVRKAA